MISGRINQLPDKSHRKILLNSALDLPVAAMASSCLCAAARRADQLSQLCAHFVAGQIRSRLWPDGVERLQLLFRGIGFVPFQIGLDEVQMVFGIVRRKSAPPVPQTVAPALAADAHRPARRFAIKQAQVPFRPGVVERASSAAAARNSRSISRTSRSAPRNSVRASWPRFIAR